MTKVEYNRDTYNTCLCGGCPVNRSSPCVGKQEEALASQTAAIENEGKMPDPKTLPGIYCATSKSACGDLNRDRSCLCPACPVFINGKLINNYYCLNGSAEAIG